MLFLCLHVVCLLCCLGLVVSLWLSGFVVSPRSGLGCLDGVVVCRRS